MEIPIPVPVDRLRAMLGGAKKLMNKVESGDYETGNIDARALNEDGVREMQNEGISRPASHNRSASNTHDRDGNPIYKNMATSKLPDSIKKAMMEQPIQQVNGLSHTFDLDDVSDMIDKPMPAPSRPKTNPKQRINENYSESNSDLITVSRNELSGMIKDELIEFLTKNFTKNLTEEVIAKTINTLIKEGKINTKKRV